MYQASMKSMKTVSIESGLMPGGSFGTKHFYCGGDNGVVKKLVLFYFSKFRQFSAIFINFVALFRYFHGVFPTVSLLKIYDGGSIRTSL